MVTKKITLLCLASLILSNVGCSGSRLRNMVGRSEYSSLEELEAESADGPLGSQGEAIVKSPSSGTRESLVSDTRELDPDDPVVKQKRRKGFFDFAKVFNRKSDEEEFAPDPFSESSTPRVVKSVSVENRPNPNAEKKQVSTEADKFSSTISAVEKQAETIFEEGLANSESALFETEPADDKAATDGAPKVKTQKDSFADFVRQQADASPVVADVKKEAGKVSDKASAAKEVVSEFDAFLNDTTDSFGETAAADTRSDLFPGLSEEFDAAFEDKDAAEPTRTALADVAESDEDTVIVESAFAQAAHKHGFAADEANDPWAAFGQGQTSTPSRQPQADTAEQVNRGNGFAWARAIESAEFAQPAFTLGNTEQNGLHEVSDQTFLQVSSTRPLETGTAVQVRDAIPLMIPGASTNQPSAMDNDPFLAVPSVDQTEEEFPSEIEAVAAVPTVATAEGGLSQWSRRTWFLLIGCLIVAMLLFMPDRHNRTNS